MKPLFIIGYMASGKTTFGRALSRELQKQFIDLDFYIEQRYRKSIPRIFEERGEAGFRTIEAEMLREVGEFEDVIVSCGGGTPCFHDNMDYMLSRGDTMWLEATPERIAERVLANPGKRPLLNGKSADELAQAIAEGLESRLPHYSRAKIHWSGQNLDDLRQIADNVKEFISQWKSE